jgi:single-strand DNA-binding protein
MINRVILVGRITKDPELKTTQSSIPVVTFTLAVNRQYSDTSGEKQTDFIQCVVWRKQAENMAKYVHKGDLIGVDGRIQTRQYEGDNGMKYVTEIVADSIQFLETKGEQPNYPETDEEIKETFKHGSPVNKPKASEEEDLPF